MPKQVSIKWDSGMERNYGASVDALREYTPQPDLSASIRLKGSVDESVVEAIAELADTHSLEIHVTLTATWPKEAEHLQLRLFGPLEEQRRAYRTPDQEVGDDEPNVDKETGEIDAE